MKHLILFENFVETSDLLYDKLSLDEFRIFLGSHNMVDFDSKELDYLSSIFDRYSLVCLRSQKGRINVPKLFTSLISMDSELKIYKFDDEWFLVEIFKNDIDISIEQWKFYKCDTFDGIKELMIDNGVRFFSK